MGLSDFPRRSLAFLPTPLVELPRFTASIARGSGGPRIFMKRDDQTGLATGGNKARKLEFLVGDALARGCDTLITGGAAQSNHCRQTAAAAAACGLGCHLALGGRPPERAEGNLLIDTLLGAEIHWSGERRKGEDMPAIAEALRSAGKRPDIIPYGGSNAIGALGFAAAAGELGRQLAESGIAASRIVFASSSGGTQAGLMVGARLFGLGQELTGICIDKAADGPAREGGKFADRVLSLASETAALVGLNEGGRFLAEDLVLRREFTGGGYGVVGELERRAIGLLARTEGILVDPVYTGRALGALIAMVESGEIRKDECLVFWHTGGTPALFAYEREILPPRPYGPARAAAAP
jgi:D-cysteine desulfhydrase family pyridoxal phosphate-dependent enzyme